MPFFNEVFYRPILNLLVGLYNIIPGHDLGIAIVLLTLLVRLILFPFFMMQLRSQEALQRLQPLTKEIQEKYKDDKEKLAKELMQLYSREKVNPASSCLPLLIQFPFLIALYQVLSAGIHSQSFDQLYSFVANPGQLNTQMFSFFDLAVPSLALAILAGIVQFVQTRMLTHTNPPPVPGAKDENALATMNKSMMYTMPIVTVLIGMRLPAGVTLYWFVLTVLMIVQQRFFFKKKGATVAATK